MGTLRAGAKIKKVTNTAIIELLITLLAIVLLIMVMDVIVFERSTLLPK